MCARLSCNVWFAIWYKVNGKFVLNSMNKVKEIWDQSVRVFSFVFFPLFFHWMKIYIDRKSCWSSVLAKCFLRKKGLFLIHGKDLFELLGYGLIACRILHYSLCFKPFTATGFLKWLLLFQGEEGLVHFQWLDRTQNIVEDVSFVFSGLVIII